MQRNEHCFWSDRDAELFTDLMLRTTRQHGVIFYDTKACITGWNQGAYFITGFDPEDVIGQPTAMLFSPEDRERKLDEHEMNTAAAVGAAEDERWHMRKDGSRFWSTGISLPMRDETDVVIGFVKVFRDATHLRSRMKYLENVMQQCKDHKAQHDIFIGTIAHELRNPLSPLKTVLELMKKQPEQALRNDHALRIMDRQLGFLERLVEDLVDLTRVNVGKLAVAYEHRELQAMLIEALDACQGAADAKQVALRRLLPPVSVGVEVDPERLHQVVINLLNNAIKFTPSGGSVWLTATVDQTHFLLYIKDDGKGIAPDLLPQIFEMFTQAHGSGAGRGAGLGIGLALVKEIVSLHRGTVEVRSEGEGRGSEFIVRIPQRKPDGSEPELKPPGTLPN